jgi:DNA primase
MDKRGLSKQEALAIVGWKPNDGKRASCLLPKQAQDERPRWHEPPEQWQAAAPPFYQACQRTLWSPRGQAALDYLKRRGLTERIIKAACIGYQQVKRTAWRESGAERSNCHKASCSPGSFKASSSV